MSTLAPATAHALAVVALDEASHVYTHREDGSHPPSVTTILGAVPPWLGLFDHADPDRVAYKGDLGRKVHQATHYFDEGTLDADSVDPVLVPYLIGWEKFCREKHFRPVQMETLVYHPIYGYAGTVDRLGAADTEHGHGYVLLDLKTGDGSMAGPQTAAYLEAWRQMVLAGLTTMPVTHAGDPIDRWTVQLHDTGRYTLTPHRSRRDWRVFLAAFELYTYTHGRTR